MLNNLGSSRLGELLPTGFNTNLSASVIRLRLRVRKAKPCYDVEGVEGVKWLDIKEEEKAGEKGDSGDRDSALAFVLFIRGSGHKFFPPCE